ncbi:MAG: IS30 family transposase, partial [Prevotella sp.]|nr:IS30 family transposase [Prevotella sp.]
MNKSAVSRELRRNGGRNGRYNFLKAHGKALERRRSPGNRAISATLRWRVVELLTTEQWSPKQISGRLKKEGHSIPHETVYAMIRADRTGKLACNCRHRMKYRKRAPGKHETKATSIRNRVSIHERPPEADGTRFGDWAMDLIVDREQNAILTLVERSSDRFLMTRLRHGKQAVPPAKAAWRLLLPYKG